MGGEKEGKGWVGTSDRLLTGFNPLAAPPQTFSPTGPASKTKATGMWRRKALLPYWTCQAQTVAARARRNEGPM